MGRFLLLAPKILKWHQAISEAVVMMNDEDDVFCVCRGHSRHEHMLHLGWDSHPVRHYSHRVILQAEGKAHTRHHVESAKLFLTFV